MDSLELRRSVTRRETEVYLMGLLYLVIGIVAVWWTVGYWIDAVPLFTEALSTRQAVVLPVGGLVVTGLTVLLLWWGSPMWQLVLRPGSPEDVMLYADREGMLITDAGYTVRVPWTSLSSMRMEPGPSGRETLLPVVSGPVVRSRGRLAALVERGLRRGAFRLRLEAEDPTPAEVRAGIRELSGGQVEVV